MAPWGPWSSNLGWAQPTLALKGCRVTEFSLFFNVVILFLVIDVVILSVVMDALILFVVIDLVILFAAIDVF